MGDSKKFSLIVSYFLSDEEKHGVDINLCRVKNANILAQTLFEQDFDRSSYEFILVADEPCADTNLHDFADKIIHMPHQRLFNKSWFFNTAARVAESEWFFFLDLDVKMPPRYLELIAGTATNPRKVYSGLTHFKRECKPGVWDNGLYVNCATLGYSSIIHNELYWAKGGMCENFRGYGGEDGEMYVKHKPYVEYIPGTIEHSYHSDSHVDWDAYKYNVHLCQVVREHLKPYLARIVPESKNYGNIDKQHWIDFDDLLKETVNPHKR